MNTLEKISWFYLGCMVAFFMYVSLEVVMNDNQVNIYLFIQAIYVLFGFYFVSE